MRFIFPPIVLGTGEPIKVTLNDRESVLVPERLARLMHTDPKIDVVKLVFNACLATDMEDNHRELLLKEAVEVVNMILAQTVLTRAE